VVERFSGTIDVGTAIALAVVAAYVLVAIVSALRRPALDLDGGGRPPRVLGWALSRRRVLFTAKAVGFALLLWCVGLALAPDKSAFLAAREWQVQPVYLAVHLITLRLFSSIFAVNYLEATAHLDLPHGQPLQAVRHVLGWRGIAAAVVAAVPFCAMDLRYFLSAQYPKLSGGANALAVDWLMYAVWCLEWLINAMIWVTLVSFLVMNVTALRRAVFRAPIHIVLLEKQYRPFLRMSVQGATVVLLFGIVTAGYIAYAGGEWTDYLGLIITATLLAVCFVPPWLVLKRRVNGIVQREMSDLRGALQAVHLAGTGVAADPTRAPTLADMESRQRELLALLRMLHLDRLHQDVGRREATAVAIRLFAPALTIGWHIWNTGGLQKVLQTIKGLM
jgi:hypothetical protein